MTLSIERIKMEIEKIFLCGDPERTYEALKMLEVIEGLPKASKHFAQYQKRANGNLRFLWAGYFNMDASFYTDKLKTVFRFSDMEWAEIQYYLDGDEDDYLSPYWGVNLEFETARRAVAGLQWRETFGPFKTAREKLKSLGIDGTLLSSLGLKGPEIGLELDRLSRFVVRHPERVEGLLEYTINQLKREVNNSETPS